MGRAHRSRYRPAAIWGSVAVLVVALAAAAIHHFGPASAAGSAGSPSSVVTSRATPTRVPSGVPSTPPPPPSTPPPSAALTRLRALVAEDPPGSTSVAAYDETTDRGVRDGATGGMTAASVAKLQLIESLLLERQRAHEWLSGGEVETVTRMIENSDNTAANTTWKDVTRSGSVLALEPALGLSGTATRPGRGILWGLTTTSASQQLALLGDLLDRHSPLSARSRAFILHLMRHVEADQRWGVPVVAASGSDPALKNGWLAVAADDGKWAVNSIGIADVSGDTVLVAIMTQHEPDFATGVARVQRLVRAAVAALG